MKKTLIFIFATLALPAMCSLPQDTDNIPLPKWFMQPAEHRYVGICEPNGDIQEAINIALMHYLICHDFSGEIQRDNMTLSSDEKMTTSMQTMLRIDTTVQYSIEEIVSTPKGEYICSISDRPTLSRRIQLTYLMNYQAEQTGENEVSDLNESFRCYYNDKSGKSAMSYTKKLNIDGIGNEKYTYSSQYIHENGVNKEYMNEKMQTSLCEQLIRQYMTRLENGFIKENEDGDVFGGSMSKTRHHPTPISGFEYVDGNIIIDL